MKKVASGVTTISDYDVAGNLISESEADGTPLRDIVYMNGERIAMRLCGSQAGWYYFVNDHLGTPQKVVDSSGVVVWQAAYLPFGKAQVLSGSTIVNNFRFPGQYYDAETELHYNWNRYYMPSKGRYLTPDPVGLEAGINLYAYVVGNPLNLTDPLGLGEMMVAVAPLAEAAALLDGPLPYGDIIGAGIMAAAAAFDLYKTTDNLSDPNPVPKIIRKAYEDIITGNGTPQNDDNGCQKKYRANELKETKKSRNVWDGSLEWNVPGTNHRILQRPDGKFGYVLGHDYAHPKLFPTPWY